MEPDELDKEILEYIANEEPWHIVCAVFYHRFDEPKEVIERVFRLQKNGLVRIWAEGVAPAPTAAHLLSEAQANDWYEDVEWPEGPIWNVQATSAGFNLVCDRFEETGA